jgi:hypothetical protein
MKGVPYYRELVNSFMYAMGAIRLDLSNVVNIIS